MIHAISEELLCSKCNLTISKFESSKRLQKCQCQTPLRFWCREHPCKVTRRCMQFLKSYHVDKDIWIRTRLKVQKGHTKFIVKVGQNSDVENLAPSNGTIWCNHIQGNYKIQKVLSSTTMWPWPSLKGQTKVNIKLIWAFDEEIIPVKFRNDTSNSCRVITFTRQLDRELVWTFKKITQRSMSKLSEILM